MKIYILMDIGCHECGIGSEFKKAFKTKDEADIACKELSLKTGEWRDGGQSIPEVFEIELPN